MSREELSSECRTAAEALQVLSNVNPAGILTRVEASAVPTSVSNLLPNRLSSVFGSGGSSTLGNELADRFPTIGINRSRKRRQETPLKSVRNNKKQAQRGRQANDIVHKDIFIPFTNFRLIDHGRRRL